jgi:hypothetical protein
MAPRFLWNVSMFSSQPTVLNGSTQADRENRSLPGVILPAAAVAVLSAAFHVLLLSRAGFNIHQDHGFGLVFNDMLLRLLRGEFSIDPAVIGIEAYVADGKTYAYFGVLPAILRLPLLPFFDLQTKSVAVLTCTVALAGAVFFLAASVLTAAGPKRPRGVTLALIATCAFAGIPSSLGKNAIIYHEAALWTACLVAAYLFVLTRPIAEGREPRPAELSTLALVAGLCVHARVSTAFGLCLATTLLILRKLALDYAGEAGRWRLAVAVKRNAAPPVILAIFASLAGVVNYMRWGNPFEFADFSRQIYLIEAFPQRLPRLMEQGVTNLERLWFGLQYYFLPLWAIPGESGRSLFADWMRQHLDAAEMPASSFFLTDALWIGCAAAGIAMLIRRRGHWGGAEYTVVLAGLACLIPALLMLVHIFMALRYRIEFQPVMMLLAVHGLARLRPGFADAGRTVRGLVLGGALLSIAATQALALLPTVWGPTHEADLRQAYQARYEQIVRKIGALLPRSE